jgi:hypothetical protein
MLRQGYTIISQLLLFLKESFGCGFAALGNIRANGPEGPRRICLCHLIHFKSDKYAPQ